MAQQIDWVSMPLEINGHRVTGYASDEPPFDPETVQWIEDEFGPDGTLYGRLTGRRGGSVMLKLQPTSPSTQFFLRDVARIQNRERVFYEGSIGDPVLDFSVELKGGMMRSSHPFSVPGKTFEIEFVFEEIIPNYDNASFAP